MGACVLCDDKGQSGYNTLFVIKVSERTDTSTFVMDARLKKKKFFQVFSSPKP